MKKFSMFGLVIPCVFLIIGIVWAEEGTVIQVIDGDTCMLESGHRIRYLGIDAPERNDPLYREATQANNRLVGGKRVRFELGSSKRDRFGRFLAYVFVDDTFVNKELVHKGYAYVRGPIDAKYKEAFLKAQEEARSKGSGIWAKAKVRCIYIAKVHADAEGNDRYNLNDEYIVIENRGSEPINLTGWTVFDEAHHRYLFPNFVLEARSKVILHTGLGKNSHSELFWGSRGPVWNNDGDSIFIRDADNNLILSYVY